MLKKLFFMLNCFLIINLLIDFSFAQSENESKPKIVKAIEINGNKTISNAVILSKIKTKIGQEYLTNIISDDIKRLYNTGYFSDVSVDTQDYNLGLKVIYNLKEKPIIEKLTFSKIRFMREKRLRDTIKSKEGSFFDEKTLKEDLTEIEKLYEKSGFSEARLDSQVDLDTSTNKVKVKIVIEEGYRQKIKKIFIKGNKTFTKTKILRLIKTRSAWLFASGFYKKDVLDEDKQRLVSFYEQEGFLDVKVDYTTEFGKKGRIYVTFQIDEGKRYYVGQIEVNGNTVFSQEEIIAAIVESLPGKVYSKERLDVDLSNVQSLYFDEGYIFAQVKETTSLDSQTGKVNITLNIEEDEVAYVEKIKIKGNIRTKDVVIRRELRIYPGERFDGATLRRSKERLRNLGFFEEVSYDIEPGSTKNKRDLVVEVKEAKTGEFSFGGGYSTVEQVVGFVEIEQKNFDFKNFPTFTGDGQNLKLHAETGTVRQNMQLSFTEPWFLDYPVSFGFDGYKTVRLRESDVGYGYDEKRVGGDIRFGKEFSEYLSGNAVYTLEDITIDNIAEGATSELAKESGTNTISSLGFSLTHDARDNIFDPTKGLLISGSVEGAGGLLGGDKDFARFIGRTSYDIPSIFKSVLEARLRIGFVDAYGDTGDVPIYERFFAGGAYTIRGYNERKVGPLDASTQDPIGGNSMLVGNIEYTLPLIEYIKIATFFDTGSVWKKVSEFGSGEFKSGMGLGLRIKTPIGPIRLDYGYPLNDEPGEEGRSGKFYFSMSHGF